MSIKKISKIVVALVLIATVLSAVSTVFGMEIPTPSNPSNTAFKSTVSNILGVVQFICYAAAVILLVILGIKFMTASPDGKAEVKKSAVIYVVGAVMVFAAGAVLNLVKNLLGDTIKES